MYFEGIITIDPSHLTKIERKKPTKAFKRMLYYMTLGGVTEKQERETFTAVSILQQLNMAFSQKGISNIIRLSHDDIDFYLDDKGKKDDLKEALDLYDLKLGSAMSTHFDNLLLVLEHEDELFKYLLEVQISRNHSVGEHPIEIKLTGLLKEFSAKEGNVKSKLENVFSSQESYDEFKREKHHEFSSFMSDLILCIKKSINVDDIHSEIKTKIVVSKTKIESKQDIRRNQVNGYHGLHYGYYGFDDFLFYSFLWASIGHGHSVMHSNTYYESETGSELGYLQEVDSSSSYFDDSTAVEDRTDIFSENESEAGNDLYASQTEDNASANFDNPTDMNGGAEIFSESDNISSNASSGSWFDFGSFGSSDSSFDSSCSSCSSCASCGGD
ncbi:hypothetical protein E1171_17715 [Cytophagales bacterium RKSG123]|nr:hypothetical protein [Xanthovirga aplysinae]